ncbi:MAG TPA: disulfide bond formation protein B [Acidimicrobiales bacterium]|nr:disulfide bond formation protein B [Acidimicrobiales bacterium]
MDTAQLSLFFALLALACWVGLAAFGTVALVGRRSEGAARLVDDVAAWALPLAAAVAVVATAGSLYYSEVADFVPCQLCWYQRIAMYPLAVVLPLAAWRRDYGVRPYALAVAGLGILVSAYHNVIETNPDLSSGGCDPSNPCTIRWVEGLGFWTIPRMAFVAFALVITLLLLDRPEPEEP